MVPLGRLWRGTDRGGGSFESGAQPRRGRLRRGTIAQARASVPSPPPEERGLLARSRLESNLAGCLVGFLGLLRRWRWC